MAQQPQGLPKSHPATILATWFGAGLLPTAPGTWGSLATLPIVWLVQSWGGLMGTMAFIIGVCGIGLWSAHRYSSALGAHDPSSVVIDEVAGQAVALIAAFPDPMVYAAGFLLFRLLDIAKPGPIGWADRRLAGGLGIMMDDLIAGAIAAPVVGLFAHLWGSP